MTDSDMKSAPPTAEQQYLRRSLRRIVMGREIGPRSPRWQIAWKRTLFSYAQRMEQLSKQTPQAE